MPLVRIKKVADQGAALTHHEGRALFVPFAAPGDLAEVRIVKEKRSWAKGRLERVVEPSPLRVAPVCPHFTRCGGCAWQHLDYPAQLTGKAEAFRGFAATRLGLEPTEADTLFGDPIGSKNPYGYRNRVGLAVRATASGVIVGFAQACSRTIVPIDSCPVAHPDLGRLIGLLPTRFAETFGPHPPTRIDLQRDDLGDIWAVLHTHTLPGDQPLRRFGEWAAEQRIKGVYLHQGMGRGPAKLFGPADAAMTFLPLGQDHPLRLRVSPGGFVQANPCVNATLIERVATWAAERTVAEDDALALDLYCGAGNFTLPLASACENVLGVEGYAPATRDAAENAGLNHLGNVQIRTGPVEEVTHALADEGIRPGLCLLDPPRQGAAPALGALIEMAPRSIAYVSCSPPTLLRDLERLRAGGYRLVSLTMADMFPQTAHMEALALLERDEQRP